MAKEISVKDAVISPKGKKITGPLARFRVPTTEEESTTNEEPQFKAGDSYEQDGSTYKLDETTANALNEGHTLTQENLKTLEKLSGTPDTASQILANNDLERAKEQEQNTRSNLSAERAAQEQYDNARNKEEAVAATNDVSANAAVQNRQNKADSYKEAYNSLTPEQKADPNNYRTLINAAKADELTEEQITKAIEDYQSGKYVPGAAGKAWIEGEIAKRKQASASSETPVNKQTQTTTPTKPEPSNTIDGLANGEIKPEELTPEQKAELEAKAKEMQEQADKESKSKARKAKLKSIASLILDLVGNTAKAYDAGFHGREHSPTFYSSKLKSLVKASDTEAEMAAKKQGYETQLNDIIPNADKSFINNLYSLRNSSTDISEDIRNYLQNKDPEYIKLLTTDKNKANQYLQNKIDAVKQLNYINSDKGTSTANKQSDVQLTQATRNLFKDKVTTLNEINKQIQEWEKCKAEAERMSATNAADILNTYKSVYAGTETFNKAASEASNSQWALNAGVNIKMVNIGGSGGHSWSDSVSSGTNVDQGALQGIAEGRGRLNDAQIRAIKDRMIANANAAIEELQQQKETINSSKEWNLQDGIVKGKGVAQTLIRGDGSVIHFDPEDTIIATTNDVTDGKKDIQSFDAGKLQVTLKTKDPEYYIGRLKRR